jgi:hypothetical protein
MTRVQFCRMTFPTEIGTIALGCGYAWGGMLHGQAEWLTEREALRRRLGEDLGR